MKKFYYILLLLLPVLAMTGCSDESLYEGDSDSATATLSYRVSLDEGLDSRAIGDGAKVNQLKVGIFQDGKHIETKTIEERVEGKFPVEMTLLKNLEYTIVFWAQAKDNGIYTLDENTFEVGIDYSKYTDISLEGTEYFEAFYAKDTVTLGNNRTLATDVKLTRPFAQLNIAAKEEDVFNKVESASLTIENVYTGINLLKGHPVGNATGKTLSFNYSDEDATNKQSIKIGEDNYYYVASAYLFSPEKVKLTGELYDGSKSVVKSFEFPELTLKPNYRTNIYGEMIQMEELAPWDGITFTQPEFVDNKYVIDEEADLAWLSVADNTAGLSENSTFVVMKDVLNMGEKTISSIQLPVGSTFDGNKKTIKNFANSLFGDAANITVQNLVLDNVVATSTDSHVGVLVNTLKGTSTFTNVSVKNSSATTTNGAAGGMVGYIVRNTVDDRSESLTVTFSNCDLEGVIANGSASEGKFVGLFSGYDNGETLSFDTDCSVDANTTVADYTSPYMKENQSVWIIDELPETYDGWLGIENYRRGVVKFGNVRLVPKWDGETEDIVPLVENNINVIYSPYDLVYFQKKSPTSVTFKADVDLGSKDFDPIYLIKTLDGEYHTVYNLKVHLEKHDGMGAAFIQTIPSTESNHKNLTLVGADVKNVHDTDLYPAYAVTNDGGAGNAYAGIFISKANSCSKYTIENIHVKNSKLYAVCKMGGIIGQSTYSNLYMSNCSVDNCTIQNYKPNVPNYYVLGSDSQPWMTKKVIFSTYYINLLQWWYTNGEAGGLIGFLKNPVAKIDNCSVKNTKINCVGEPDKNVVANVYSSRQFNKSEPFNNSASTTAQGMTTIAGRHVNQFIGDIVSERVEGDTNYIVEITNYSVDGNSYNGVSASETNSYNHQYDKTGDKFGTNNNLYCEVVGCAYYIGIDLKVSSLNLGHMKNCAGSVEFSSIDGNHSGSFTESVGDDSNPAWVGGNFSITSTNERYPSEPAHKNPEYF